MRDSDPRRRSGGHPGESKPGNEPLDQGLHRMLGGAPADDAESEAAATVPQTSEPAAVASDEVKEAPKPRRTRRKPAAEKAAVEAKAEDKKKEEPVADAAE